MFFPTTTESPSLGGAIWISDNPEHQQLIEKLSASDPRLRYRDSPNVERHIPWPPPNTRVFMFEAQSARQEMWKQTELHDSVALRESLQNPSSQSADGRRIVILEGQAPVYIDVLTAHFGMHPAFFVDHERRWLDALPSAMLEHITMKYFELIYLPLEMREFSFCCAESGRPISATRVLGEFTDTGILHRKCTVWRRTRPGGGGWDCVIITDLPLRSVAPSYNARTPIPMSPRPHRGGYLDFVPHYNQMKAGSGPSRMSMSDDISFYLMNHHDIFGPQHGSDNTLRLAQKIVASHYHKQAGFLLSLISRVQSSMSRQEKLDRFGTALVEKQWSDVQSYERRVSIYCHELDSIMHQCRIPLHQQESKEGWLDVAGDFQCIRSTLRDLQRRVELLNSSVTGLAGIAGNRQAVEEQKLSRHEATSMKALTIVGLVFLPLSFTASLFGMPSPYGFGEKQFWVYFVLAIPLTVSAFGIYFVFGGSWASRQSFRLRRTGSIQKGDDAC